MPAWQPSLDDFGSDMKAAACPEALSVTGIEEDPVSCRRTSVRSGGEGPSRMVTHGKLQPQQPRCVRMSLHPMLRVTATMVIVGRQVGLKARPGRRSLMTSKLHKLSCAPSSALTQTPLPFVAPSEQSRGSGSSKLASAMRCVRSRTAPAASRSRATRMPPRQPCGLYVEQ